MRRTLNLKRETLTELTAGEMAAVNGGSHACVTEGCTSPVTHGISFDNCPTLPINECLVVDPNIFSRIVCQ